MKLDPCERQWDQAFGGIFWDGLLPLPPADELPFPLSEEEDDDDDELDGGTSGDEYYLDDEEQEQEAEAEPEPEPEPEPVEEAPAADGGEQQAEEAETARSDCGSSTDTADSVFGSFPEGTLFEKFSYEVDCLMCPGYVRYHFVSTPDAAGVLAGLIQGKRLHPVCGQCFEESLGGGDLLSLPLPPLPGTAQEDDGQ